MPETVNVFSPSLTHLIYNFLVESNYYKTAKKFKKEAGVLIDLQLSDKWSLLNLFQKLDAEINLVTTDVSVTNSIKSEPVEKSKNNKEAAVENIIGNKRKTSKHASSISSSERKAAYLETKSRAMSDNYISNSARTLCDRKGKDFAKEKNKKKKATWIGNGAIRQTSNSVFFSDSD